VPGHLLIRPKRHVKYCEELTPAEKVAIESLRLRLKNVLQKTFDAQGFNYAWVEESVGGQSVAHLHLHMLPRTEGDAGVHGHEPREFLYRPGPRTAATREEELAAVAQMIRATL
jgi:diadenosine tetraphosphate (Ap4A) HIT family hydrolase